MFLKMGIADICIAGDDRIEYPIRMGLAQHLQGCTSVNGWVAHREQETEQSQRGIVVVARFLKGLQDLGDGVEFKITWRYGNYYGICGRESIHRQPG